MIIIIVFFSNADNIMSPSMAMEMNSKTNVTAYRPTPDRHHVRNLWPPVGGGLPGGKPVEPALQDGSAPMLQNPSDYYGQSTSYGQTKPPAARPPMTDPVNVDNDRYYYKSSQVLPNPMAAANAVIAPPAEYSHYYGQQPKYFQHAATAVPNRWIPPSSVPPQPLPYAQTSQLYPPDPTTLFNQVSLWIIPRSRQRYVTYLFCFQPRRGCPSTSFQGGIYTDRHRTSLQLLCPNQQQQQRRRRHRKFIR